MYAVSLVINFVFVLQFCHLETFLVSEGVKIKELCFLALALVGWWLGVHTLDRENKILMQDYCPGTLRSPRPRHCAPTQGAWVQPLVRETRILQASTKDPV